MSYSMSGWASDASSKSAAPLIDGKLYGLMARVYSDFLYIGRSPLSSIQDLQKYLNTRLVGYRIPTDGDTGVRSMRTLCAAMNMILTPQELSTLQAGKKDLVCTKMHKANALADLEPYKAEAAAAKTKRKYCKLPQGACFTSIGHRDTVRTQLQFKVPSSGLRPGESCPTSAQIDHQNMHAYRNADMKNLRICGGRPPIVRPQPPVVSPPLPPVTPPPPAVLQPSGGDIFQYTDLYWGQGPDARVAAFVREHINPALRKSGYQPLSEQTNFNMSVCAAIKTQFGDMVFAKFKCPYGIPNPHQFLRKGTMGIGSSAIPYCSPRENMCFDSYNEKDTAQTQCQYKYKPDRGTKSCIIQGRFMANNQNQYDPCEIASYPICPETAVQARARILAAREQTPQVIQQSTVDYYPSEAEASQVSQTANEYQGSTNHDPYQPPAPNYGGGLVSEDPAQVLARDNVINTIYDDPEPEIVLTPEFVPTAEEAKEEEESSSKMMYGILAAVVIGGGAVYFMTRKKKKR